MTISQLAALYLCWNTNYKTKVTQRQIEDLHSKVLFKTFIYSNFETKLFAVDYFRCKPSKTLET